MARGETDHDRPARPSSLHRYGQNHLVDANILRVILAMAAVRPDDVVLEVGAADGLLTERLLEQAAVVHAFEIDRRFAERLGELVAKRANLRLHVGDALKAPLDRLEPSPTHLVANLAYNIAIPLIVETAGGAPTIERWAVMVQKELEERLFAPPRTKAYSAVSVLVQLACELVAVRPIPRTVFSPIPSVDSAFVTFKRRAGWPREEWETVARLVRLAFGQRRKMLTNSLSGAAHAGRALARDDVRRALEALALPEAARPEELVPPQFVALAREVGWSG
jgi:16S rRNA (adenine1518-N6/adenine1519-N6)-dimethyltransferase